MTDIATAAGVSQPTVSLVLNGSAKVKISKATRQKVLDTASRLGYQLKHGNHAHSETKKIALVLNVLVNIDPFIDAINAARETAWQNDYILTVFNYADDKELAIDIAKEITTGDYCGVIFASSVTQEMAEDLFELSLPSVYLNCIPTFDPSLPTILPADLNSGYTATKHLIEKGFTKIAIINGESWMIAAKSRLQGYKQALLNHDLIVEQRFIKHADWSMKTAYLCTKELLESKDRPQAIFCCSDYMAMGCAEAIKENGLKIPEDISVVGHDNLQLAAESIPSLTTVQIPYFEMGKQATQLLVELLSSQAPSLTTFKVEGPLVIRESSGAVVSN
ncbi:LacI family DNA-binding transcriptional regulator [Vibrio cholerae]